VFQEHKLHHATMRARAHAALVGAGVGAAAGFVLLGLGGRLAMRLIAVWTDPRVLVTLNGAVVGEATLGGTARLALQGAISGAILGLGYLLVRRWLPDPRTWWFALVMLFLPGGVLLADSEFELFHPPLLAALLFLPIFPVFGFATAFAVERLAPAERMPARPPLAVTGLAALGLVVFVANAVRVAV
jgi:hypothetical protein